MEPISPQGALTSFVLLCTKTAHYARIHCECIFACFSYPQWPRGGARPLSFTLKERLHLEMGKQYILLPIVEFEENPRVI